MMDWLFSAALFFLVGLVIGAGAQSYLHRCPEPLQTIAGFDDWGYEPVVVPEMDNRVYKL